MKNTVHKLKYYVAAMLLVFATSHASAQSITNPDFEILTTSGNYPITSSQLNRASGWTQPTNGTSDYFYGSPSPYDYRVSSISAQHGSAYVGGYAEVALTNAIYNNQKEYITTKLSTNLIAGVTYTITFYTLHLYGGSSTPGFDSFTFLDLLPAEQGVLGLCFSAASPTEANTYPTSVGGAGILDSWNANHRALIPASNQQVYGSASRNTWVPVTLTYTADGTEQYMTIGQWRQGYTAMGTSGQKAVYYLYDNFSMTAVQTTTPVATGTNPTTPTGTGSVSLSASTGSYPASTPVSVTYTTPSGTTTTYAGTTDANGKINIPNLPAGTYPGFVVSVGGAPASAPSNSVTLVAPPATPVPTGTNPTTPGGTNGSVTLSPPSGFSYPANAPVTVTYTKPDNTTATYTGTSDGSGHVTVPNLPAGTYTNFTVAFNGGAASSPSGPVTLSDCASNAGVITRQ